MCAEKCMKENHKNKPLQLPIVKHDAAKKRKNDSDLKSLAVDINSNARKTEVLFLMDNIQKARNLSQIKNMSARHFFEMMRYTLNELREHANKIKKIEEKWTSKSTKSKPMSKAAPKKRR